ncbi:hypothetical protein Glove_53g79 [Diversispora epigaea]|uniref:Uncharacterized protein n=1 Tax=Diversispora epigaea TaxID=1348612 RepID=A0A397JGF3_9GLOM|nr:hypothetical protein Glove_53g79 [Diversispora epigaea]
MSAKLTTICYIHDFTNRIASSYTLKEITGVIRLDNNDPQKIMYLKIKSFIPLDVNVKTRIEEFEKEQVVLLTGKFIAKNGWYSVSATSIQVLLNLDFDTMPAVGLQVILTGVTTQTVQNSEGKAAMKFFIEEYLGDRESTDFWVEMRHETNNQYLANKTNVINSGGRSTTAILVGSMKYKPSITDPSTLQETEPEKHILELVDISILSTNRTGENRRSPNVPWLNNSGRTNRPTRGATPRTPTRRGRTTSVLILNPINPDRSYNPDGSYNPDLLFKKGFYPK